MNKSKKEILFCSYAHKDTTEIIKEFEAKLEKYFDIWADYKDIMPGANWELAIAQGIQECNYFCVFASQAWVNSAYCFTELKMAKDAGKPIILILLDEQIGTALPHSLAKLQWIMWDEDDYVAEVLAATSFIKNQKSVQPTHYLLKGIATMYESSLMTEFCLNTYHVVPINTSNLYVGKIMKKLSVVQTTTLSEATEFFEITEIKEIFII